MPGPNIFTRLSAANPAVSNRLVTIVAMKATAYTLANTTMPTTGARRVTVLHATVNTTDTLGTLLVTGTDLRGLAQTETITPSADTTVTGSKWFVTVSDITPSGWVQGGATADNITIGVAAGAAVCDGNGWLESVTINTTAAGAITLTDGTGTIASLKSSIAEGIYIYRVNFSSFLQVTLAAASDATVIHTPSMFNNYSK